MLRLAIVGCGEHSRSSHAMPLARYAADHPGEIELVAACDLSPDRAASFCRDFGFSRAYTDVEKMLAAERIDGCVCVMPIERIVELGVMLLEQKIPCVVEKPLGASIVEAERLARVARDTGTPHMVSVNRRFMPYLNRLRSWAKAMGPTQYIKAAQVRHGRSEPDFIWSTAIHAVDALRYIAGEITKFEIEVFQPGLSTVWYALSLRFESGTRGRLEVLPTAGMVEESYELFGEGFRGRVVAGSGDQRSLQCWRQGKLEVDQQAADEPEDLRNGAYFEVVEFVGALRAGRRPGPMIEDILPSLHICSSVAERVAQQIKSNQN